MQNTDIASRMLHALTNEPPVEIIKNATPIDEQKRYLKRYVDSLSIGDKKNLGNIIIMNDKKSSLVWCSEGTAINLDILPPAVVEQLYDFVSYKIGK